MVMKTGKIRIAAWLTACFLLLCCAAGAEATLKETTRGGKVVRLEWQDENGAMITGPEGYAYATRNYSGTTITEKYFTAAGQPAAATGGYYGRMLTYGNRHRLEEIVYLNENGQKANCAAGYARLKIAYNSNGGVTALGYYGENGGLVMVPSLGYAALKSEYRGKILTKTTWLDEKKNPVDTSLGYAVLIQTVNKNNKLTGIRFEHADGSAAVCPEGWASCKRELDKNGREFSVKYYDLSGKMIRLNSGYAYEEKTWDGDRTCTIARFDESGNPVPAGNGYTLLKQEFSKGLLIRETCLDANGKTVEDLTGTAIRTYTWDEDGRLSQVRYADAQSVPALNSEGCAGYSEMVDGDGFRIARTYLGTDGKPVNTAGGYSEIRYLYNENGQLRGTEYYDVNGVLVKAE